jgi:sensor histidine kinase YesM
MYSLFWAISFYICLEVFSRTGEYRKIDVIYTFLFHIPMIFAVTTHSGLFLEKILAKGRYVLYSISLFLLLVTTILVYHFTFNYLSSWLFEDYFLVGVYSNSEFLGLITIYLILGSSLEFSKTWFGEVKAKAKLAEVESEKVAAELKALRAQVNPHFLFNSLNTIYSEALKKSDKAPRLILKLSDMLRYVVDKMEQEQVALAEEVEYLTHFVDLNKERLNEPEKVTFKVEGNPSNARIVPLLLIIFVENCFKHGDLTDDDSSIQIKLKLEEKSLMLYCKNSVFENPKGHTESLKSGIENAKRRLELAYKGRYSLDINSQVNFYETTLKMELS